MGAWELEDDWQDSIDDMVKVSTIVNKIRALGEIVDETYVFKKILHSVSLKYLQIASTIEEFGNLSIKSIEEVVGSLKAYEEWLRGCVLGEMNMSF